MLYSPKNQSTESGNIFAIILLIALLIIATSPLWAGPVFEVWNTAATIQQNTAGW